MINGTYGEYKILVSSDRMHISGTNKEKSKGNELTEIHLATSVVSVAMTSSKVK